MSRFANIAGRAFIAIPAIVCLFPAVWGAVFLLLDVLLNLNVLLREPSLIQRYIPDIVLIGIFAMASVGWVFAGREILRER